MLYKIFSHFLTAYAELVSGSGLVSPDPESL